MAEEGLAFTIVSEAGMERMTRNKNLVVLGELEELQTSVFAMAKKSLTEQGKEFLKALKASSL